VPLVLIMQGCAAGRGLLALSGQEFSGLSCWQEFAVALLAGIRWADLLAVVRRSSLVRGVRNSLGRFARTDLLDRSAHRNRWHGFVV